MSFIYDIRNLKDCSDFKTKREDFFRMLRLQAKLNRNYEQATIARQQMDQLGITPVMQARRSIEDEQKDLMLQQQLAIKNLSSIMSDDEVRRTIHFLNDNDIYFLNTEFGRLKPFLEGRANITADFFKRVLQRFKLYLESTGMTGVPIPLRETTLQSMPGDLKDEWENYSRQTIDPMTGKIHDLEELIRRTAEALNRTMDDVKQEVVEEQKMEVETETPLTDVPAMQTTGSQRRRFVTKQNNNTRRKYDMNERVMKRQLEEIITGVEEEFKVPRLAPEEPFTGMISRGSTTTRETMISRPVQPPKSTKRGREEKKMGVPPTELLPDKKGKVAPNSAALRGVKRKDEAFVEKAAAKKSASGSLTLDQARSLARSEIEARQRAYVPPVTRAPPRRFITPATEPFQEEYVQAQVVPEERYDPRTSQLIAQARDQERRRIVSAADARARQLEQGQGLFISPQRQTQEYGPPAVYSRFSHGAGMSYSKKDRRVMTRHGKVLGKSGAGLKANDELKTYNKYRQLGKYMLHVPSLSKSMVNVKYPSLVTIPSLPSKFVSVDFIELLWKLVDENVFERNLFNRLSEEEQDYFKFLARKCQFDQTIGFGVGKSQTKEEMEELKRFELLKGTIIAGNNSPEVIAELRRYVLKFLSEKRIPKQQGHDLLYEISCLS